jgi:hypothetical protein
LHAQRLLWKPHGRNAICWAIYRVNDNKPINGKVPQIMQCLLCYKTHVPFNPITKLLKGLISYYKMNGIITLKKHVDPKRFLFARAFDEEMNNLVKSGYERQLAKNKQNVCSSEISKKFIAKIPCKKKNAQLKQFLELLLIKNHLSIHFVKSYWLKRLAL